MSVERHFEPLEEEPHESFDVVDRVLVPMWRARLWIALTLALGLLIGAFLGAIRPNTYESVGKLLVRVGAREQGTAESRVVGSDRGDVLSSREAIANELHLLANPIVYENVARRVGPERILAGYDPAGAAAAEGNEPSWLHRFQSWWFSDSSSRSEGPGHAPDHCARCVALAVRALGFALEIQGSGGSSVITVVCTTNSPQLSADVVDAFIAEALVHHQAVFSSGSSLDFLQEQVQSAQAQATLADEALADYRVNCGFYDTEVQRQQILSALGAVESELAADNARLSALESRERLVQQELSAEPRTQEIRVRGTPVPNSEHVWLKQRLLQLRDDLMGLEGRRDLTTAMLETQRSILSSQIATTESELASRPEFLQPGETIQEAPNPRFLRLREQLDEIREEQVALRSSVNKRVERLAEVREQLVSLERCVPTLRVLETAATQSRQRLAQFLSARERVSVMDLLDSVNMINLRPLQAATVPLTKSGPQRGRLVAVGGLLGLACGIALAFLLRTLDQRLRTREDVARIHGTAFLGVVPELPGPPARTPAGGRATHRAQA
ncbi:MAG: hypothetical protein JNK02_04000 [Planctomycetes bacterium]|nr:hypothetical protein [Planctomycetota bacterium]